MISSCLLLPVSCFLLPVPCFLIQVRAASTVGRTRAAGAGSGPRRFFVCPDGATGAVAAGGAGCKSAVSRAAWTGRTVRRSLADRPARFSDTADDRECHS